MNQSQKVLLTLSACLLSSLALLAGCGDDGETSSGGASDPAQVSSDATPTEVYQGFMAALAAGDAATACPLLSPEGLKQVEAASIGGTCEDWVGEVESVLTPRYKDSMSDAQVDSEKIDGEKATLEVQDPALDLPLEVELDQIDGSWKLSKLSSFV